MAMDGVEQGDIKSNKDKRERCKYCLDGAMEVVCLMYPNAPINSDKATSCDKAYYKMQEVFETVMEQEVVDFNDQQNTTHQQVLGAIKRCINYLTKEKK